MQSRQVVSAPGYQRVLSAAVQQHFLVTHQANRLYSIPVAASPHLVNLHDYVSGAASQTISDSIPLAPGGAVVFQVGMVGASRKKTIKVASISGRPWALGKAYHVCKHSHMQWQPAAGAHVLQDSQKVASYTTWIKHVSKHIQ